MSCFIVPMVEATVVSVVRRSSIESRKSWVKLEWMLWGGSLVLCAEHLIKGEFGLNFYEMATNGVAMSILVTLLWLCLKKAKIRAVGFAALGTVLMIAVDLGFSLF